MGSCRTDHLHAFWTDVSTRVLSQISNSFCIFAPPKNEETFSQKFSDLSPILHQANILKLFNHWKKKNTGSSSSEIWFYIHWNEKWTYFCDTIWPRQTDGAAAKISSCRGRCSVTLLPPASGPQRDDQRDSTAIVKDCRATIRSRRTAFRSSLGRFLTLLSRFQTRFFNQEKKPRRPPGHRIGLCPKWSSWKAAMAPLPEHAASRGWRWSRESGSWKSISSCRIFTIRIECGRWRLRVQFLGSTWKTKNLWIMSCWNLKAIRTKAVVADPHTYVWALPISSVNNERLNESSRGPSKECYVLAMVRVYTARVGWSPGAYHPYVLHSHLLGQKKAHQIIQIEIYSIKTDHTRKGLRHRTANATDATMFEVQM